MNHPPPPPLPAKLFSLTALLLLPLLLGLTGEAQAQGRPTVTIEAVGGTEAITALGPGPSSVSTGECVQSRTRPSGPGWRKQGTSNFWCTGTTTDARPTKQFRVRASNWPSGQLHQVDAKVKVWATGSVIIGARLDETNSQGAYVDVLQRGHLEIWLGRNQTKTFTVTVSGSYSSGSIRVQLVESYIYKNSDQPGLALRSGSSPVYNIGSPNSVEIVVNPFYN